MSAATGGAGTTNSGAGNPTVPSLLIREEPNYGPGGNITRNGLAANQTLTEKKVGPYKLSYITNHNGTKRMVRKITFKTDPRRGQFEASVQEEAVYRELIKQSDYADHVLPYVRSKRTNNWVYIDWAVVNGMDFERYVATLTDPTGEERKRLLLDAIRHLHWLLNAGYSHGDVKLSNFFIDTTGKTYIIDFGTSRKVMSTSGIMADIFNLFKMASVLLPRLTEEKVTEIQAAAKAAAEGVSGIINRGKRMYKSIAAQITGLATSSLVGGKRRPKTRRQKRRARRTHRSIPRIIR